MPVGLLARSEAWLEVCAPSYSHVPTRILSRPYLVARPQKIIIRLARLVVVRPGEREARFETDGEQQRERSTEEEDKSSEECL